MNNQDIEKKVRNVIDQIRPYLQRDGGDIEFLDLTDDMQVNVKLVGACGTYPFSILTLKNGIEQAMIKAIPEIKSVEAINIE